MQVDRSDLIRNLAVAGHNDTGKTTLASGLSYTTGVVNRHNRVEDGNTITDFDEAEIQRGISIGLGLCFVPWRKHKINLIDCPGYGIFLNETRSAMRAADATLLCVNGVSGVQVTAEKVWESAENNSQPVLICLTKMDRENADFERVVTEMQDLFNRNVIPLQVPIGSDGDFRGVVDLISGQAHTYETDGDGKGSNGDAPGDLEETIEEWRGKLMEAIAESDEDLMEAYFEEGELNEEQMKTGLRKAVVARSLFPVVLTAAGHGIGNSALLDAIVEVAPSPVDVAAHPATDVGGEDTELERGEGASTSAIVFKTMSDPFSGKITLLRVTSGNLSSDTQYWNSSREEAERVGQLLHMQGKTGDGVPQLIEGDMGGVAKLKSTQTGDSLCEKDKPMKLRWIRTPVPAIAFAIEPKSKGDEERIGEAIGRLVEEDPSLRAGRDPQTGEYLLSGAGDLHVEIAVQKLKARSKVEVILHPPKVPYKETLRKPADGHGRHKKQSGGRGQFADCKITIEPTGTDGGYEWKDEIFGGSIPQNYRPAVEKGILETASQGYLAGYEVVDFKVRLLDGQYHDVDSSEMAFKIAGSLAFKDAMAKAGATILEPVMTVEINTSEEFMGDIMGDLSQRRGKPQGMEAKGNAQIIKATVPMSEMLSYAPALRSMTQGRSSFEMEFSHYEEVPKQLQDKIIQEAKVEAEADA